MNLHRALRSTALVSALAATACGSNSGASRNAHNAGSGGAGSGGTGARPDGSTPVPDPVTGLGIAPKAAQAGFGGTVQFKATGSIKSVKWSVQEGDAGGTVSSAGLYSAPSTSGTFHVVVTASDGSASDTATVAVSAPKGTPPVLTVGTWTDLTPPGLGLKCCPGTGGNSYGNSHVAIDPSNPSTLYVTVDQLGMYKSTDRGSTWNKLGDPAKVADATTSYLDSPIRIRVDPSDSGHLYATQGVRGATMGFWVSHDGGDTWSLPKGFLAIASTIGTRDMTTLAIDPTDFSHVLVGSHSPWKGMTNAGVLESKDGGETFTAHQPDPSWGAGSIGIEFLYEPTLNLGDAKTWLIGTDGVGFWRTTDAGTTWKKVSDKSIPHGGMSIYYTKAGVVYSGATEFPLRSKDNGLTWEQVTTGLPNAYYYTVHGDGNTLYTQLSYTGDNGGRGPQPYMTSPETDGSNWAPFNGGAQTFSDGPFEMRFDAVNHIMYSANWDAGMWALKVQ